MSQDPKGRWPRRRCPALAATAIAAAVLAMPVAGAAPPRPLTDGPTGVTATLYSAWLHGLGAPGDYATAALFEGCLPGGTPLAWGDAVVGPSGTFSYTLADGADPVAALPGRRIAAAIGARPVRQACLPDVAARVDRDDGTVSGVAPPGSLVTVTVLSGPAAGAVRTVVTDPTATYRAHFGPGAGLDADASGSVALDATPGLRLALRWAAPRVELQLGGATLEGRAAAGRSLRATVSRGDRTWATAAAEVSDADPPPVGAGDGRFYAELRDGGGLPANIEVGDLLDVVVGDDRLAARVPAVTAETDIEADVVWGLAPPGAAVEVTIGEGEGSLTRTVHAGPDGLYAVSVGDARDLVEGEAVTAKATVAPGIVVRALARPGGLALDLDHGRIAGSSAPGSAVRAEAGDGSGTLRASGEAVADGDGRFAITLRDGEGRRVSLFTRDTVTVTRDAGWVATEVPLLSVAVDAERDVVGGAADPTGEVVVTASSPLESGGGQASIVAARATDGAYTADFAGRLDIAAGTRLSVQHRTASGHVAFLERLVPALEAQSGGDRLAGFGGPSARVTVELARSGAVLSSRGTASSADGAFAVRFVDATGRSVRIDPGDVITAAWAAADVRPPDDVGAASMTVAAVTATIDPTSGLLAGLAPAGARVHVTVRDPGLPAGVDTGSTVSSPTGTYALAVTAPDRLPTGAGVSADAAVLDAKGHRTYALAVVPYLDVLLGSPSLAGRAMPLAPVGVRLLETGSLLGAGDATTDSSGYFTLVLRPVGADTAVPRIGHRIELDAPSTPGGSAAVTMPRLSAAIDPANHLLGGEAPPGSAVDVEARLSGRPAVEAGTMAGPDGRWRVAASDLPGSPEVGDILEALAAVLVEPGHRVRASSQLAVPTGSPSPPATGTPSPEPSATSPASPTATATDTPAPTATSTAAATRTPVSGSGRAFLPLCARKAGRADAPATRPTSAPTRPDRHPPSSPVTTAPRPS